MGGADIVNEATIYDILCFVFPAVTFHELYQIAAHEAKIVLRGVKSASAATAWSRIRIAMTKKLEREGSGTSIEDALHDAFQLFDEDGSGTLDVDELDNALKMLGLNIPFHIVQEMVDEVDDSGDGLIDVEELMAAMFKGT